jgi:PAS domain S-box-containing protein
MVTEVSDQLSTLAELKVVQIQNWRSERIIDGQTIQTDVEFSNEINQLMQSPSNIEVIKKNIDRLRTLLSDPNYSSILLVDQNGKEILHVGKITDIPSDDIDKHIGIIKITHEILLTNLYEAFDGTAKMDMLVPIFISGDQSKSILGYLNFIITPDAIFYPLIQSLPTTNKTAETLLVRKEDDEVVYLNELRFRSGTALKLKFPVSETQVPAVMAVKGITGIVKGNDYRGVPVMASIVPIGGTDWKLIAKIDMEEINLPIEKQLFSTILTAVFLIIAGILSITVLWRRQSASITKGLSISEGLRKNLEEKYSTLFNQANDAILLVEENGKILEANHQAVKMYGYTQEELLDLSIGDLRDASTKPAVSTDMDQVRNGSVNIFETTHKRKNGELFQVDVSSRYLSIGGKGFFQSLVRDITEKKQAEENLRLSELELKKAQSISHVGSWHWDLLTDKIELSDELFDIFNLPKQTEKLSFVQFEKSAIHPDDYDRISKVRIAAIKAKRIFSFESKIIRPDGKDKFIRVEAGELIYNHKGDVVEVSGIAQDITEMKAAERELRKSENLLQRIYDLLPVGLWITDENGKLVRSNKMVKEIWGKDILVDINGFEVFRGRRLPSREEIKPNDWASVHTIREGVTIRDEMVEIDAYDGKTKTILNYSTPIFDDDGKMEGSIVLNLDISELKKAEEQLSMQLDELRRWNMATLGRENRIRELKMEINKLLSECGKAPIYNSVLDDKND